MFVVVKLHRTSLADMKLSNKNFRNEDSHSCEGKKYEGMSQAAPKRSTFEANIVNSTMLGLLR